MILGIHGPISEVDTMLMNINECAVCLLQLHVSSNCLQKHTGTSIPTFRPHVEFEK
jgi:hypothetical protein